MISLKGITGGFHGIDNGVSGVDNYSARNGISINEVRVSLGVGKILHILRKNKRFKLTYYNGNFAVEVGDVSYEELENASLGRRIRCGNWNFKIPNSQQQQLVRILA